MWGLALADFGRDPRSSNSLRDIVFLKTQKLLTKFPGLATSGRRNSAMITDRQKFTFKLSLYGRLVSIFTVRIISKSFTWDVRSVQERYLPNFFKFSSTSEVRYCALKPILRRSAGAA